MTTRTMLIRKHKMRRLNKVLTGLTNILLEIVVIQEDK